MKLKVGDVFWYKNPKFFNKSPHPHIVVEITSDRNVIIVYTSSEVANVKYWCRQKEGLSQSQSPKTFVSVDFYSCPAITKKCAIDCNNAFSSSERELIDNKSFSLNNRGQAGINLITKIKEGIKASRIVSDKIKNIL